MTNCEVYFGTLGRAEDSLMLLLDYPYPSHPRKEVREWQEEIKKTGTIRWLKSQCTDVRWYKTNY